MTPRMDDRRHGVSDTVLMPQYLVNFVVAYGPQTLRHRTHYMPHFSILDPGLIWRAHSNLGQISSTCAGSHVAGVEKE